MKQFVKKMFGIDKIEAAKEEAERQKIIAETEAETAKEAARIAALSPKELATEKKEPWVAVLDTKVNPENPRNGFFELDWNDHFVVMLRNNGFTGGSDEEVVDAWFGNLCKEIGNEEGVMMDRRFAGYINVNNLGNGKSEIS
jgi:hypothetical protein